MTDSGAPRQREQVIARFRPHARILFVPALIVVAAAAALGYFYQQAAPEMRLWLAIAAGAIVVLLFIVPLFVWLSRRYIITSRRVIVRSGLFVRVRTQVLHARGYDITVRRNWLQSAFRSGTICLETSSERRLVLHDVPRAALVQAALNDLVEANHIALPFQQRNQLLGQTLPWGQR